MLGKHPNQQSNPRKYQGWGLQEPPESLLLHGHHLPPAASTSTNPNLLGKPTLHTDQVSLKLLLAAWAQPQSHSSCQPVPPHLMCPQGDAGQHPETLQRGAGRCQLQSPCRSPCPEHLQLCLALCQQAWVEPRRICPAWESPAAFSLALAQHSGLRVLLLLALHCLDPACRLCTPSWEPCSDCWAKQLS